MKRFILFFCFLSSIITPAYAETIAEIKETKPGILIGGTGYDLTIASNDTSISGFALMITLCNRAMWAVRITIGEQKFDGKEVTVWYRADNNEPVEETWNWHPEVSLAVGIVPKLADDLETADRMTLKVLNNQATFDLAAIRKVKNDFFKKCASLQSP